MRGIGLFGAIGSGKTSTAFKVKELYDGVEIFSFASPLKELAEEMLGRKINKATDRLFVSHVGQGARSEALKFMGRFYLEEFLVKSTNKDMFSNDKEMSEFFKRVSYAVDAFDKENPNWGHSNFWVDKLVEKILQSDCKIAVVDDLRFQPEYDALKSIGFVFAETYCPRFVREERIISRDGKYNPDSENHPSELEWIKFPAAKKIHTYDAYAMGFNYLADCPTLQSQLETFFAENN